MTWAVGDAECSVRQGASGVPAGRQHSLALGNGMNVISQNPSASKVAVLTIPSDAWGIGVGKPGELPLMLPRE